MGDIIVLFGQAYLMLFIVWLVVFLCLLILLKIRMKLINKNIYNWITYTNFGKATVLLNAISKECTIEFEKNKPFTNFKRINNFFVDLPEDELELMKDYLNKTNRRFKLFQDKIVERLIIVIQATNLIFGLAMYLVNGDKLPIVLFIGSMIILLQFIKMYEKERNVRETLLMFIERAENNKGIVIDPTNNKEIVITSPENVEIVIINNTIEMENT